MTEHAVQPYGHGRANLKCMSFGSLIVLLAREGTVYSWSSTSMTLRMVYDIIMCMHIVSELISMKVTNVEVGAE